MEMANKLRNHQWLMPRTEEFNYSSCLSVLIYALKIPIKMNRLCEALPFKAQHIGLVDIFNALAHLGYIARPAQVRFCDLDERLMPCLFVPDRNSDELGSPVVVMGRHMADASAAKLDVFHGDSGKTGPLDRNNSTRGSAYFFTHQDDVEDMSSRTVRAAADFSWFRALLERFRGTFWQVFAISLMLGLVSLSVPLFVMLVYDQVINAHSPEILPSLIIGAGLALLMEWRLRSLRSSMLAWFSSRLDNIVSNKIFEQLMLMPPQFIERASVASQIARLKAFEAVREFFAGSLFVAMIELPFTLVILAAIAYIAGPVAIIPVITAGLYSLLIIWFRSHLKMAIRLAANEVSKRQQMTVETLEKMHTLRASGMTSSWFRQYRDLSGKASLAGFRANFLAVIVETIAHGLFILSGMATIVWSIEQVWAGSMTTGGLIATIILVWRVLGPFQIFCTSLPRYEQLQNAIAQINRLMEIQIERDAEEDRARVTEIKGHVSFSKVGLRYTKEVDPVFTGLSFDIQPGQLLAITGANGAGKSTILKLINGMYHPQAGTVRIDDVDIRQLDPIDLRKHIAYVSQTPHFFQGTIADNLRFAEPLANEETLIEALQQVRAWDEIRELPNGLETKIGKNHIGLPTGLAYRLNLARAYIKETSLMLFDELPYALLNSSAGEAYSRMIGKWRGHRTIVMITHREDYFKMADVAIYLKSGHPPLVGKPSMVAGMIDRNNQ